MVFYLPLILDYAIIHTVLVQKLIRTFFVLLTPRVVEVLIINCPLSIVHYTYNECFNNYLDRFTIIYWV